ncbi:MAG: phosphate-starvation-inducible PsiE family protein [Fournierella sp.]|uniref:phosphate-starvation-inducible PsiE family protein n=1 Tax=Allofournierella sp. TaxID=1940256 RepID=UPI002A7FC98A|nr:phosphate-starvation-inducible PsiE family protein [Fournierella sp.]MDY4168286.1 phosphate-starvation-inducible PsiE family protein [Fournierella sp.]
MKRNRLIFCRQWVARMASIIETVVALVVLLAILVAGVRVLLDVQDLFLAPDVDEAFTTFLRSAFNVVIGIEFVKMLAKHSPGSAIEVLLFAIARQMVVEHTSPMENLVSILAILLIFVIRKYLFVPAFGAHMPGEDTFGTSSLNRSPSDAKSEEDED